MESQYRCCFHFRDLGNVILVVDTVAQDIAEISQSPLQGISSCFFFRLFKSGSLPLAVFNVTVSDILELG